MNFFIKRKKYFIHYCKTKNYYVECIHNSYKECKIYQKYVWYEKNPFLNKKNILNLKKQRSYKILYCKRVVKVDCDECHISSYGSL